jgi:hypothetical protein
MKKAQRAGAMFRRPGFSAADFLIFARQALRFCDGYGGSLE